MAAKKKTTRNRAEPKKKPVAKKPAKKQAVSAKKAPARVKKAPARKARTAKRLPAKRPVAKKKVAPARKHAANPEGLELARAIANVAHDKKASDVLVLDLSHKAGAVGYDYLVLASGDSDVQLDALKNGVEELLSLRRRRPSSVEPSPDWVCLNLDDVVVHFFTPDKRELYDLEGLWSDAARVPLQLA
ncbi:MAG: ribosome silencing factor [Myxococcaceae bacterium]|nr:ribosome silencing factor [Myxococcaceae bacterium]